MLELRSPVQRRSSRITGKDILARDANDGFGRDVQEVGQRRRGEIALIGVRERNPERALEQAHIEASVVSVGKVNASILAATNTSPENRNRLERGKPSSLGVRNAEHVSAGAARRVAGAAATIIRSTSTALRPLPPEVHQIKGGAVGAAQGVTIRRRATR